MDWTQQHDKEFEQMFGHLVEDKPFSHTSVSLPRAEYELMLKDEKELQESVVRLERDRRHLLLFIGSMGMALVVVLVRILS